MDEFSISSGGVIEPDEPDEPNGAPVGEPPSEETPPQGAATLHRSATKRVFGGVCGGLAERFDVDPNIVRVVFVVLALVYGLGIALYLAMWVLIPRDPSVSGVVVEPAEDAPRVKWLRYALPLSLVVLAVIFIATIRVVPTLGKAFSLLWLVFLVVLAVIALFTPARRLTFRRLVALAFLGFISFLIVLSGATLLTLQVIGVPLEGGSGLRDWQPTTMSEVQPYYRGAFGSTTIDLSHVDFSGTTSVTASEGIGQLIVDVPADVTVDLHTHVGIGNIDTNDFVALAPTTPKHGAANLVLTLDVGIGNIQLFRVVNR